MKAQLLAVVALAAILAQARLAHGKEGDSCFHRRLKKGGSCQPLSKCTTQSSGQRQQCPFKSGDLSATVCCPLPDKNVGADAKGCDSLLRAANDSELTAGTRARGGARKPGAIATAMCRQYAQHVCVQKRVTYPFNQVTTVDYCESQNRTDQLIVGGREARAKEYPHMVLLGFGPDDDHVQYLCGGTIISPNFVLTAAHCVYSGEQPVRWVLAGARLRSEEPHKGARPQRIAVSERIKHPNYKPPVKYNDIALLRLAENVEFVEGFVRPACLSLDPRPEQHHKQATATGWGLTDWDGEQSSILMTVNLDLTPLASCQKSYGSNSQGIPRGILDTHICAGSPGKDSCEGDSGGPLQLFPSEPYCMFHVVGIVSFGQFCGFNTPGVYTRVASYLSWIEDTVWPLSLRN